MRARKSREAIPRVFDKLRDAGRVAGAQSQNADREREQIFDAMVHFPKEKLLPLMRPLGCGDVTGDFRGGDDLAFFVFDRRNGEGNIDEAPVLALSNRLVVMDSFAAADPFEDKGFFVLSIHWDKNRHRPSHGLLRRIAKEELRAMVPSHNSAVEILGKDRVVRRFNDGHVVLSRALATQTLLGSNWPGCSRDNLQPSPVESLRLG